MDNFNSLIEIWHQSTLLTQQGQKISNLIVTFFVFLASTVLLLGMGTILWPIPVAQAAMVMHCDGFDAAGNPYTATYVNGLFPQVRFDRSPDLPPVVSELTYDTVNEQGDPIYRGSYLGAADIVLIDLSKGNVKPGSEVSLAVDNFWNLERGICGF